MNTEMTISDEDASTAVTYLQQIVFEACDRNMSKDTRNQLERVITALMEANRIVITPNE